LGSRAQKLEDDHQSVSDHAAHRVACLGAIGILARVAYAPSGSGAK